MIIPKAVLAHIPGARSRSVSSLGYIKARFVLASRTRASITTSRISSRGGTKGSAMARKLFARHRQSGAYAIGGPSLLWSSAASRIVGHAANPPEQRYRIGILYSCKLIALIFPSAKLRPDSRRRDDLTAALKMRRVQLTPELSKQVKLLAKHFF
ncbi:hypothetical protein KM043_016188 [Ampulex compressa]|nr:hypothetical protein KM043_016188 [Ampulex compressa]